MIVSSPLRPVAIIVLPNINLHSIDLTLMFFSSFKEWCNRRDCHDNQEEQQPPQLRFIDIGAEKTDQRI